MGTVMAEASVIFEVWQSIDYWYQIVQIALRDSPIVRLEGIGDAIPAVVIVADRLQTEEKANRTGVRCGIRYVGTVDLPKIEIWIKRGLGERILLKPYKGPIDHLIFLNPEGDLVGNHYPRARQLLREQNRIMFITSGPGILMLIRIFLALQNENVGRKVYGVSDGGHFKTKIPGNHCDSRFHRFARILV